MQGFCPLCSKNGIQAKIKAFQINYNEAVFMCSTDECLWPAGCQELTFINRSIEEDWSKTREEIASEILNNCPQVDNTVPDQSAILTEDNCCIIQEDTTTQSKPCDLSLETNIDNELNLVSQPVDSEPINGKAGVPPMNNIDNSDIPSMVHTTSTNMDNVMSLVNDISTSLDNNFVPVKINNKTSLSNHNLSRLRSVSKSFSVSSKLCNRTRKKGHSYKKFNLNDLQKAKSTNIDKEVKSNLVLRHKEFSKEQENSDETNRRLNNRENQPDIDSNASSNASSHNESDNSEATKNNDSEFNLDEFLNGLCNGISGKTDVENTDEYDWIDSLAF